MLDFLYPRRQPGAALLTERVPGHDNFRTIQIFVKITAKPDTFLQ